MKRIGPLLINLALAIGAVVTLVPLLWMISASLMPTGEATAFPPRLLPSRVTFEHYRDLLVGLRLARSFGNSMLIAVVSTLLSLFFNSMAGYAFAKLRFRGRDRIFTWLIAALAIPAQIAMLPLFLLLKLMGLVNTYVGAMIPLMATIYGIFLVRQFMVSVPQDIINAARIDGANEWEIYWSVILPLARPVLATLAIFTFMSAWNDFMWPLIVLSDHRKYTMPVAIANLVGEHLQDLELMMASSVITVIPVLVLFFVLQKQYIAGVMAGSIKG
ncbi:MAG TPA: carbohydrate ABC transporter permease [Thermoanaerobaculia bacterium]|jgi:multiple sugar transport system permease protein|nr:carbohydrate ABC transporter permease [Thermoanaerobaculia bacterium]